jgi:MoaA/NifB/PqqE/SkfB family radical SAM enzyme
MIEELRSLGTRFISFTGGEPLLRKDIDEIVSHCKTNGLYASLNSNGFELKDKPQTVKKFDFVIMSLDGQEAIHDYIRGDGSYRRVLEAAEMLKENKMRLNFAVTLTKFNLDQIGFLMNKANEYNATITFQPASLNVLYADRDNAIRPSEDENKKAIQEIMDYKSTRKGRVITNSFSVLRHLYDWPNKRMVRCASGQISCRIKSNGDLCLCNRNKNGCFNALNSGLGEAFNSLPKIYCDECWCAQRLEINLLFSLNWEVILNNLLLLTRVCG